MSNERKQLHELVNALTENQVVFLLKFAERFLAVDNAPDPEAVQCNVIQIPIRKAA